MTDTFNPHEILSRLRSKPSVVGHAGGGSVAGGGSIGGGGNGGGGGGSAGSGFAAHSPSSGHHSHSIPPGAAPAGQTAGHSTAKERFIKAAKTVSTGLAAGNGTRQEGNPVRSELEKEIKKLQDEITSLRAQNKQLQADKEDVERQFIEFKIKSEDLVTKLRGKIAALALAQQKGSIDGTGKLYPGPPPTAHHSARTPTRGGLGPKFSTNPPIPPALGPTLSHSMSNQAQMQALSTSPDYAAYQGGGENFREPTFSELMRRSTAEHSDFQESLRRAGNVKGAVPKTSSQAATSKSYVYPASYEPGSAMNLSSSLGAEQFEYYTNQASSNLAASLASLTGGHATGGNAMGYMHSSMQDLMPEFDHSLPVVEIDLSKQ